MKEKLVAIVNVECDYKNYRTMKVMRSIRLAQDKLHRRSMVAM
jgi:hypothetical protein